MNSGVKKYLVILLAAVLILSYGCSTVNACTSFAECSDKVLFGSNFDYPDTPVKLNFFTENGLKVFYGEFKEGESFYMFCAMTNKGLFVPTQIQYPSLPAKDKLAADEIYIGALPSIILPFEKVSQVREFLDTKKLAPMQFPVHIMAADKYGDAVICEAGEEKNGLVDVQDKFLVMTNFKNSDFIGKPYTEVIGGGADRYIKAYESIKDNLQGFDIDDGWNVLKSTVQTGASAQTLVSQIFDPSENAVYLTLQRDFERIWKVSVEKGTIETYKGFEKKYTLTIPESGILASDLIEGNFTSIVQSDASKTEAASKAQGLIKNPFITIFAAALVLILPSFFLLKRKRISRKS